MPKGMLLKFRARMGAKLTKKHYGKKATAEDEEEKLEAIEERLENVSSEVMNEIDKIEDLKQSATVKKHEFGWIKGKVTILLMQDFIGALFGTIIFVFTQEVWEIAARLSMFSVIAILVISLISGFSLVYFSRRRKSLSVRIYHTVMLRGLEIYILSFFTSLFFILLLGVFGYDPLLLFKGSVIIALPAVISAATADLLFY